MLSTSSGIELWKTDAKSDIVVWDRLWERSGPSACSVIISPSISHIAWYSEVSVHFDLSHAKSDIV